MQRISGCECFYTGLSPPKLREHPVTGRGKSVRARGWGRVLWALTWDIMWWTHKQHVIVTWLLHDRNVILTWASQEPHMSLTRSSHDHCIHAAVVTYTSQWGLRRSSQGHTPNWGAVGSWQLLGDERRFSLRMLSLACCLCPSGWPATYGQPQLESADYEFFFSKGTWSWEGDVVGELRGPSE